MNVLYFLVFQIYLLIIVSFFQDITVMKAEEICISTTTVQYQIQYYSCHQNLEYSQQGLLPKFFHSFLFFSFLFDYLIPYFLFVCICVYVCVFGFILHIFSDTFNFLNFYTILSLFCLCFFNEVFKYSVTKYC